MFGKGKINMIRTLALGLVFGGMVVTYGSFLVESIWAMTAFLLIGILMVLASTVIYFIVGFLSSTRSIQVECPSCGKPTKILGKIDQCMHCNEELTLDRDLATDVENSTEHDHNS